MLSRLHLGWRRRGRVPVILQTEAAECGLACLAMVARMHAVNARHTHTTPTQRMSPRRYTRHPAASRGIALLV